MTTGPRHDRDTPDAAGAAQPDAAGEQRITELRSFAELTVANELDVLDHHVALTRDGRAVLSELVARCRTLVSPAAAAAIRAAFPDAGP